MQNNKEDKSEVLEIITEKQVTPEGNFKILEYAKKKLLGKGGFAKVYEVQNTQTKKLYACKIVKKNFLSSSRERHKRLNEIKLHRSLNHQNIVKFDHFFESEHCIYIFLEICSNETLTELLRRRKRLTVLEVQCYLTQVLAGIKHIHSHRILHRDIKLGNIFISDKMEAKIGDFGLATRIEFDGERKRTICGTPNYIAPEILEGRAGHSYECDIWSFGVLLYTLLIGRPPFESNEVKATYKKIKQNTYSFPENIDLDKDAKDLISSILVLDFTKRPSVEKIFSHSFFTKNLIPRYLPLSTLAVPPSPAYLNNFISQAEKSINRASSHKNIPEKLEISPKARRVSSKESRNPTQLSPRIVTHFSSYFGTEEDGPETWVVKWINYSPKYGLGYLLSNNSVGVILNDNSRMILLSNQIDIQYISSNNSGEILRVFQKNDCPPDLTRKITILQMFQKQLKNDPAGSEFCKKKFEHVKRFATTSHAMIFRMTNKVIQVSFNDTTELFLSSEKKNLTFVSKNKKTCTILLSLAMESGNKQLIKRLKYAKDVLINMLKADF